MLIINSVFGCQHEATLSLSLSYSQHVAISCCYIGDPDDLTTHCSGYWSTLFQAITGRVLALDTASPHALSLHPLVSLVLTTRLSGSLATTTHCQSALIITHFHVLWLITQPSRCLSPTDPLMIDSEKSWNTPRHVSYHSLLCLHSLLAVFLVFWSLSLGHIGPTLQARA